MPESSTNQFDALTLTLSEAEERILAEMTAHASQYSGGAELADGSDSLWTKKVESIIVALKQKDNSSVHRLALQYILDSLPSLNDSIEGKAKKERWLDMLMGMSNPGYCLNPATVDLILEFYSRQSTTNQHDNRSSNALSIQDIQTLYDSATDPEKVNALLQAWEKKYVSTTQTHPSEQAHHDASSSVFIFECLKLLQEESITGNCLTSLADTISLDPLRDVVSKPPHNTEAFLGEVRSLRKSFRDFLFTQKATYGQHLHLNSVEDLRTEIATFCDRFQSTLNTDTSSQLLDKFLKTFQTNFDIQPLLLENLYAEITEDYQPSFAALPKLLGNIDLSKELIRAGQKIESVRYDSDQHCIMISFSLAELKKSHYTQSDNMLFRYLQQKNMTADIFLKLSIPLTEADGSLMRALAAAKSNAAKETILGLKQSETETLAQKDILESAGTEALHRFICNDFSNTLAVVDHFSGVEAEYDKEHLSIALYNQLTIAVGALAQKYLKKESAFLTKKDNELLALAFYIVSTNLDIFGDLTIPNTAILQIHNIHEKLLSLVQPSQKSTVLRKTLSNLFTKHQDQKDQRQAERADRGFLQVASQLFDTESQQTSVDTPYSKHFLRELGWQQILQLIPESERIIVMQHGWGASEEVNSHRIRALLEQLDSQKRTLFFALAQGGSHDTNFIHLNSNPSSENNLVAASSARIKLSKKPKDSFPGYAENMISVEKAMGLVSKDINNLGHSMGGRIVIEKMLSILTQHQHLLKTVTAHAEAPVLLGNQEGYQLLFDPHVLEEEEVLTIIKEIVELVKQGKSIKKILLGIRHGVRKVLRAPAAGANTLAMDKNIPLPNSMQKIVTLISKRAGLTDQIFRLLVRNAPELTKAVHRQQLDYRDSHLENQTIVLMEALALLQSESQLLQVLRHFFSLSIHGQDQVLNPRIGMREAIRIGGHVFEVPNLNTYTNQLKLMAHKMRVLYFPSTTHYGDGNEKGMAGQKVTKDTVQVLSAEIEELLQFSEQVTDTFITKITTQVREWAYDAVFGDNTATQDSEKHAPNAILDT